MIPINSEFYNIQKSPKFLAPLIRGNRVLPGGKKAL